MDPAPKFSSTSSRLVMMALSLVGDPRKVQAQMKCSDADFSEYCAGRKEPPFAQLDRLIELIVREQGISVTRNRELLATLRARKDFGS